MASQVETTVFLAVQGDYIADLKFTPHIEGGRDQEFMSRLLPVKLQLQVLDRLEWSTRGAKDRTRTLAYCCLVCREWLQFCQRELLRTIFLRTARQLKCLVASLSYAIHPIGTYITELSLAARNEVESFYHIALFHLSTKLPSLRCLVIEGEFLSFKMGRPWAYHLFPGHPSLDMHLKHFRTVTELRLSYMTFQSFWELRHFVAALPAVSTLHIRAIDLIQVDTNPFRRPHARVSSLFSSLQKLTHLSLMVSDKWNPLWLWVTPVQMRHRVPKDLGRPPFLTIGDAETLWGFTNVLGSFGYQATPNYRWSYDNEHQRCKCITFVDSGWASNVSVS